MKTIPAFFLFNIQQVQECAFQISIFIDAIVKRDILGCAKKVDERP